VVLEKPEGTLRLCLDPKEISRYLVRDTYQIPTLKEIRPSLANKNYYNLLDLKE